MGAGHPLGGRDGKDNVRRVALWDPQEAFAPTHHLIFSSAWEAAREDTHLTEEETEAHRHPEEGGQG